MTLLTALARMNNPLLRSRTVKYRGIMTDPTDLQCDGAVDLWGLKFMELFFALKLLQIKGRLAGRERIINTTTTIN